MDNIEKIVLKKKTKYTPPYNSTQKLRIEKWLKLLKLARNKADIYIAIIEQIVKCALPVPLFSDLFLNPKGQNVSSNI